MGTRWKWLLFLSALLWLTGCGGGGNESTGTTAQAVRLIALRSTVTSETVEGAAIATELAVETQTNLDTGFYVEFEETNGHLVEDLVLNDTPSGVVARLTMRPMPAGRYDSQIVVRACRDQGCTQPLAQVLVVPLQLTVLPNLVVDSTVNLSRTGQDPAPQITVPVTIPDALKGQAINIDFESSRMHVMAVEFDGAALRITTTQQRAGTYTGSVRLYAPSDLRYHADVAVTYTVLPPPGGEMLMAVTPSDSSLVLGQGEVATRRVHLQRPTWTSTLEGPFINDYRHLTRVRALGNDDYEVTFDASGQVPSVGYVSIGFSAGDNSDSASSTFNVTIASAYRIAGFDVPVLRTTTQSADLRLSTAVQTIDGQPARWTASTDTPWLRLTTASGTTGQTALAFEIDSTRLPTPPASLADRPIGQITLTLPDRPGVLPLILDLPLNDFLPRLYMAGAQVLVGSSGWIHVAGTGLGMVSGHLLGTPGALKVSGARLVQAEIRADERYFGDMSVLAVLVADAVPGQPITVRAETPLLATQVTVQVEAAPQVPTGHTALPAGRYRPVQYAPGQNALYTASQDRVMRWSHDSSGWRLTSVTLPGVIDVALRSDETVLYALNRQQELLALDPVTLVEQRRTTLYSDSAAYDENTPTDLRTFAYSADARAHATKVGIGTLTGYTGVDWLYPSDPIDLTNAPRWGGPGHSLVCATTSSSGMVRSPAGQALLWVHPTCGTRVYRPAVRQWVDWFSSVPAEQPLAVSDDGHTAIARSGRVRTMDGHWRDLPATLPATQVAGGYGLTADGRFALVYGYRLASESGGTRAREATLWLIDLQAVTPVAQAVPLPDAVGCTAPTTADACRHTASISVAEGDRSAFVIGPLGMAALSLGSVLDAPTTPQVQAQSRRTNQRRSIRIR